MAVTDKPLFLTENFSYRELAVDEGSLTAAGVTGVDADHVRGNARILCHELLEPTHAKWGKLHLASGFRAEQHNQQVGGKPTSFHLYKEGKAAADIFPLDASCATVFDWLRLESALPFDKVILEFHAVEVALLDALAAAIYAGKQSTLELLASTEFRALSPRCIHLQTDVDAAARRQAYIGFTGATTIYRPVPVGKELPFDAT